MLHACHTIKKPDLYNGYYKNVLQKVHAFPLPTRCGRTESLLLPCFGYVHGCSFYCMGKEKKFDQKWDRSLKTELCFKNLRATTMFRNLPQVLPWESGIQQGRAGSSHGGGRGWGGRAEETPFLLILHWAETTQHTDSKCIHNFYHDFSLNTNISSLKIISFIISCF